MPYVTKEIDGKYCNYKKSGGNSLGCFDTRAEAQDQISAIYAHEKALSMAPISNDMTAVNPTSSMVAFYLPENVANYIGEVIAARFSGYESDTFQLVDPKDYHITLIYMGDNVDSETIDKVRTAIEMRKVFSGPYYGNVGGAGYFNNEEKPIYLSCDAYDLGDFRQRLLDDLQEAGVYLYSDHGFIPHITVAYTTSDVLSLPDLPKLPLYFDRITIAVGDQRTDYEFGNKSFDSFTAQVLEKAATFDSQGNLVIPVVGIPFTGPKKGKADLVGDWFDENTKISLVQKSIEADFDHGRDDAWLPDDLKHKGFGSGAIGTSQIIDEIYEDKDKGIRGRLFNVIVDRRHKYINLIKDLADQGYLDASMKMTKRVDSKTQKGYITEAIIGKMALTPTPMNPKAVSLYKSLAMEIIGEEAMPEKAKDEKEDKKVVTEETPVDPVVTEKSAKLIDEINEIFDEKTSGDNTEKSVRDLLTDIATRMTKIEEKLQAPEQSELEKSLSELTDEVGGLREAFPVLAKRLVSAVNAAVRGETEKSLDEKEGEEAARKTVKPSTNGIPAGAPGKGK